MGKWLKQWRTLFSWAPESLQMVTAAMKRCLLLGRKAMTNLLLLLLLSRFSRVRLCATPETTAHQAPQSLGFSRQEHWSGLPFPSPMTNLNSILKSRDIILSTKVCLVKAIAFPVVMYGCESWTIKKAEHWRVDAFELCGVGEDSWESFGLQGDPTCPS